MKVILSSRMVLGLCLFLPEREHLAILADIHPFDWYSLATETEN
jgi:hypothetical protein